MKTLHLSFWGAMIAATFACTLPSRAAVEKFTDKTDFFNTIDSNSYYFEAFSEKSTKGKAVLGPKLYSFGGYEFTLADTGTTIDYSTGTGAEVSVFPRVVSPGESFTLTFPSANVTAFGGTFFLTNSSFTPVAGGTDDIAVTLAGGTSIDLTSTGSYGTEPFAGFVSSIPITSITITDPSDSSDYLALDSLYLGMASVVPEPAAWALMLGGLVLLLGLRRWRKLRSAGPLAAVTVALGLLGAAPLKAAVTTYTDIDSFENDLNGPAYFESFADYNNDSIQSPQSFSLGSDSFTLDDSDHFIDYSSTSLTANSNAEASVYPSVDISDDTMTITFGPDITAFGGTFFLTSQPFDPISSDPDSVVLTLATGETIDLTSTDDYSTEPFAGFTSDVPFTSVTLSGPALGGDEDDIDAYVTLDNFIVGQSDDTPEPASWTLMLGGLCFLGLRFWTRRAQSVR